MAFVKELITLWFKLRKKKGNGKMYSDKHNATMKINVVLLVISVISFLVMMLTVLGFVPTIKDLRRITTSIEGKIGGDNVGNSLGKSDCSKVEGDGFDSPEEALSAYIEALNDGNIDGMLATYAVESYVDHFDTKAHIERLTCFSPTSPFLCTYELSDGSDFDRNFRIKERQASIMCDYYAMLCQQTVHNDMMTLGPFQGDELDAFMNEMQENDFLNAWKNMKFIKYISPDELCELYNDELNQKNIMRQTRPYCCEDVQNVCALVEIDGEDYYQFAECVMYDGKWYIVSLFGNLASLMGAPTNLCGLVPCSMAIRY